MQRMASSRQTSSTPAGPRHTRRYHFGRGLVLYMGVTCLIAVGAFNGQNNLLYWTFGFALALIPARLRGAPPSSGFAVTRSFPFGLMRKSIRVSHHGGLVVPPRAAEVSVAAPGGGHRSGPSGLAARRAGLGQEFFALREYVHG